MNKNKTNIPIRYILFTLTFLCIAVMGITMLRPGIGDSIRESVNSVLMPVQVGLNKVGTEIYNQVIDYLELRQAQAENEALKAELERLREENQRLFQGKYELQELQELLKLREQYPQYEMVGANVIQKETGNWFREFTIDKGTDDGIFVNANVLANGALVGRVTYVGKNYARVLSIIDDHSNVGAMSVQNSTYCVVSGSLDEYENGRLLIEYTNVDDVINDEDMIVTSNVSSVYLPGLAIGYAKEMTKNPDNLTQSGYLLPIANFSNIERVLVITTEKVTGEEMPETTETPAVSEETTAPETTEDTTTEGATAGEE